MLHPKLDGHLKNVAFRISIKNAFFRVTARTFDDMEKLFPAIPGCPATTNTTFGQIPVNGSGIRVMQDYLQWLAGNPFHILQLFPMLGCDQKNGLRGGQDYYKIPL